MTLAQNSLTGCLSTPRPFLIGVYRLSFLDEGPYFILAAQYDLNGYAAHLPHHTE